MGELHSVTTLFVVSTVSQVSILLRSTHDYVLFMGHTETM